MVDDFGFDGFDGDGGLVDAQDAGAFAGGGADAAGELGEVVGFPEADDGLFPQAAVDEVVPLGDEVVDGALASFVGVAEGDAAVHAARRLAV